MSPRVLLSYPNDPTDLLLSGELVGGENLAGTEVWLRIEDNGPGMDEEQRDRVFNPFFTSKEHGTGLGLAIVKRIVEAHGGTIELASRIGEGTEFVLSFTKNGGQRRDRS